jgi:hypothetical protein
LVNVLDLEQEQVQERISEIIGICTDELGSEIVNVIDLTGEEYFIAPASSSTEYHLCETGGLARHSLHVFEIMSELNRITNSGLTHDQICLVALLHDIGKVMSTDGKSFYSLAQDKWKISKGNLYDTNPGEVPLYNSHRSLWVLQMTGLKLTPQEFQAILCASEYGPAEEAKFYSPGSRKTLAEILRAAKSLAISAEKRLKM